MERSQVLSHELLEVNPCNLNHSEHESWDLSLIQAFQVFNPKYDMDPHMGTLVGCEAQGSGTWHGLPQPMQPLKT
jgi:hypothetical protein